MSTAEQLQRLFHEDQLRALNRLVFAAEVLEAPELPEVPDWDKESPASLECLGAETRTPEELQALGLEWQGFAVKLHDMLEAAVAPDQWADVENLIADVRAKAKQARLALIELDVYSPGPGDGS